MLGITLLITWILHLSHFRIFVQPQEHEVLTVVEGELNFKDKSPNVLPPGSCIWYRLYGKRDEKALEKQAYVISFNVEYVGDMLVQNGHQYSIPFRKIDYDDTGKYFIAADVFVGRCPHINFIKEIWNDRKNPGDYSTRYEQRVVFDEDKRQTIRINLPLSYFCWDWDCDKNSINPPTYCYDQVNKKVIAADGHYKPENKPCEQCLCSNGKLTCEQIKCMKPKDSCSLFDKRKDYCCPCDSGSIIKGVKWNVYLSFKESQLPGILPLGSCLTFKVENKFDRIIHAEIFYVGGKTLESAYQMSFDRETRSSKPAYSLIVLLNYGWCPNINMLYKDEATLSNGDYENKKEWPFSIEMPPSKTEYTSNVEMKKKCIGQSCDSTARSYCIDKKGKRRNDKSSWRRNECTQCTCRLGEIECVQQQCKIRCNAKDAVRVPGKCCPECPKVETCYDWKTNRTYKDGEFWQASDCERCICRDNRPACASPGCRLPHCGPKSFLVEVDGICCPVCNNQNICEHNGVKHVEGTFWEKDDCTICRCTAGGLKCFKPMQDLTRCRTPVKMSLKCPKFCLPSEVLK